MADHAKAQDDIQLAGERAYHTTLEDPGRSCVRLLPPGTFPVSLRLSHRAKDKE